MMTLHQAARAIGAGVTGPDVRFLRVTTDTRALLPGDLYVALRGERFDGHQFIKTALDLGAAGAVVEKSFRLDVKQAALILVEDTRRALGSLAQHWRDQFRIPVAAITGSNGKTTVKEMLATILEEACRAAGVESGARSSVLATEGNLNNDIGMPLTLLGLRQFHRYAVVEMGMNHPGEILYLTRIAKPEVAIINNVQRAHLEFLGTIESLARAKGEIFAGLAADGVAVVNADDASAELMRTLAGGRRRLEFGIEHPGDVSAAFKLGVFGSTVDFATPAGKFSVNLKVPGMHNVRNAAAACSAALALAVPVQTIASALAVFSGVPGRLQSRQALHGATMIDDTYNANPDSVAAAIDVLAACSGRKILVLGDMGEIGVEGRELHAQIGALARQAGVDGCYTLGDLSAAASRAFGQGAQHFEHVTDLVAALEPLLEAGVTVLVKGSRFMQMERVIERLAP